MPNRTNLRPLWIVLLCGLATGPAQAAELTVDDVMFQDPLIVLSSGSRSFSPGLKPLWLQALARPDAQMRRMAADSFALAASRGMKDLEDVSEPLLAVLKSDSDPAVRRAAAQALVVLKAKSAAGALAEAAAHDGLLMSQIAEPALAQWDHPPMHRIWLARLTDAGVERGLLLLAIDGLGQTRERAAAAPLAALAETELAPAELRLAAARALGQLVDTGLAAQAARFADNSQAPGFVGRLLAVELLIRQQDDASIELLKRLARDSEPAVAGAALARLHAIDLRHSLPLAGPAIASPDASLRRTGARIFVAQGDVAAIVALGPLLADRNPGVRRFVAERLVEFAQRPELRPAVLEQAVVVLAGEEWRGLEQAALVLGTLDYKPAAPRLLELIVNPRGEVAVSAAWALRKLRLPETMPPLHEHAKLLHTQMASGKAPPHAGKQVSQIFQAFGELRFSEPAPLLMKFLPKSMVLDPVARGAACWALGYFHEDKPDEELAKTFAGRLLENTGSPPEFDVVRRMTAVGLGRMKAESQMQVLRRFAAEEGPTSRVGLACGWSIERMTGEKMKPAPPPTYGLSDWFLRPIEP